MIKRNVRISKYKSFLINIHSKLVRRRSCNQKKKKKVPCLLMIMFINDLTGEEIDGAFYEKEQPKTNKKKMRIERVIKKNGNRSNGKDMIIHLIVGLIKDLIQISQNFPKPYEPFGGKINVLSRFA